MPHPTHVLGPVLIAVVLNVLFYGICVLQSVAYYTSGFNDRKVIKSVDAYFLLPLLYFSRSPFLERSSYGSSHSIRYIPARRST